MKRYALLLLSALLLAGCREKEPAQTTAETEQAESVPNRISLSDTQMNTVAIQFGSIEQKNLTDAISVNGTLAVPNQNKAVATSLTGGILRSLAVHPGDFVKKGQLIGTIANTELSGIQQQLLSVNAQIAFTDQELKRQRELVAGNAAPLKNVQKAEAELNGLKAQQQALKQQLEVLGMPASARISAFLPVTAPISGTIAEISAQIGSQINANTPIAQIINNSELHLDLFVYEKDLPKIATGQTIHFTLTNNPGKEYDAVVYSIGTAFVNETKAIPVHAKVINEKTGLIEGMSVTARISLGSSMHAAVPNDAIVNEGGKDFIFLVGEQKGHHTEFERVEILKGTSDVGYTEIKPVQDIPPGTHIVVNGTFFLMAKMTNTGDED